MLLTQSPPSLVGTVGTRIVGQSGTLGTPIASRRRGVRETPSSQEKKEKADENNGLNERTSLAQVARF